eukprot:gnl/TRDRNA2_/TRDRNA2_155493_c0_seq2.p1 gnl/TRDRNA2_/TRDRNA2_155493_c0~~gnl/TRDRNA2_/TRDRNA2_155493_c0_seq2.p1  ORF type:complete len:343 (-),score=19.03 gnl/TRDRNA2_/TRDRNA2_155493_c0_seq2:41-1069(-)
MSLPGGDVLRRRLPVTARRRPRLVMAGLAVLGLASCRWLGSCLLRIGRSSTQLGVPLQIPPRSRLPIPPASSDVKQAMQSRAVVVSAGLFAVLVGACWLHSSHSTRWRPERWQQRSPEHLSAQKIAASLPSRLLIVPELEHMCLFYSFSWEASERPCNFDLDAGCVLLDYSGAFLRAVHIAEKGSLDQIGLAHGRQRRRLSRGEPFGELLGDEGVNLELAQIERSVAFLVFVHMLYAPGPHTFCGKVSSCRAQLSVSGPSGLMPLSAAEGFTGDGGALVSGVLWRTAAATGGGCGRESVSRWRFDAVSRCMRMPNSASHCAMAPQLKAVCLELSRRKGDGPS